MAYNAKVLKTIDDMTEPDKALWMVLPIVIRTIPDSNLVSRVIGSPATLAFELEPRSPFITVCSHSSVNSRSEGQPLLRYCDVFADKELLFARR